MTYSVKFTLQAEEDLARLDKPIAQHVSNKIDWLSQSIEYIILLHSKENLKANTSLELATGE